MEEEGSEVKVNRQEREKHRSERGRNERPRAKGRKADRDRYRARDRHREREWMARERKQEKEKPLDEDVKEHERKKLKKEDDDSEQNKDDNSSDGDSEGDFFKNLPPEIITNILSRLSVGSIAISKCVCKPWRHLLENDDLVKSHFSKSAPALVLADSNWCKVSELEEDGLDHYPLTKLHFPHGVSLGSSANGLLFLYDFNDHIQFICICNPITRELCSFLGPRRYPTSIYGFGVSKITGQIKVVSYNHSCFDYDEGDYRFKCYVYTLGTGSWRSVEATDSSFTSDVTLIPVGTFLNGNLHWMVTSRPDYVERIYCFDLETECFSIFAAPSPLVASTFGRRLYTLRDSLSFCDDLDDRVIIWMMKEYGVEKSWTAEYFIKLDDLGRTFGVHQVEPIKVFKNGDVLMLCCGKMFMYYSKMKWTAKEIGGFFDEAEGEEFDNLTSLLFSPSLVSLKRCFGGVENVISF